MLLHDIIKITTGCRVFFNVDFGTGGSAWCRRRVELNWIQLCFISHRLTAWPATGANWGSHVVRDTIKELLTFIAYWRKTVTDCLLLCAASARKITPIRRTFDFITLDCGAMTWSTGSVGRSIDLRPLNACFSIQWSVFPVFCSILCAFTSIGGIVTSHYFSKMAEARESRIGIRRNWFQMAEARESRLGTWRNWFQMAEGRQI